MQPLVQSHLMTAMASLAIAVSSAVCAQNDAVPAPAGAPFSDEILARLRNPIPDLPSAQSPSPGELVDRICRFGNLRIMCYMHGPSGPGQFEKEVARMKDLKTDEERRNKAKELHEQRAAEFRETMARNCVTMVTHVDHGAAESFNYRYDNASEARGRSLGGRAGIRAIQDCGALVLLYMNAVSLPHERPDSLSRNWDAYRAEYESVLGPLPEKMDDVVARTAAGKLLDRGKEYWLAPDAPYYLLRTFCAMGLDVNNGADGMYWDELYYPEDCGPHATRGFQQWLSDRFPPEKRKELFGTDDVAQLTPLKATGAKPAKTAGPGEGAAPLAVALTRYRCWKMGRLREQIRAFGRKINPRFIDMTTYWSHSGSPYVPVTQLGLDIEDITRDGNRDAFFLFEAGAKGPKGGPTFEEAKAEAAKAGDAKPFKYGRRSFSCSLKQMVGASYTHVVSKLEPQVLSNPWDKKTPQHDDLTELLYAESWSNLVSMRVRFGSPYSGIAILRMHAFQAAHPDFFVGSRPRSRVGLVCSTNWCHALRPDLDPLPFSRRLTDMKLEHRIVSDRALTPEGMAGLDTLILFKAALLSDAQLRALESFRKEKTLVVVGPAGTHDEWGRPRQGGLQRLVGDLAQRGEPDKPAMSADSRAVYLSEGSLLKAPDAGDLWYRHSDDGDVAVLREAIEKSAYGKAWPYLSDHSEHVEVHLAEIADSGRIVAHVVNYDVSTSLPAVADAPTGPEASSRQYTARLARPAKPFELAVNLGGGRRPTKARFIAPELTKPEVAPPDPSKNAKWWPEYGKDVQFQTLDLPLKVEKRHGADYAVVSVPEVRICGIVAIE